MYSIYIKSKDIDKIKLCDTEAFSLTKVNDSLNIRFQSLDHFESCRKKIYNSIKGSDIQPCASNQQVTSLK